MESNKLLQNRFLIRKRFVIPPYLELAKILWKKHLVHNQGVVIDATLGRGSDTLFLCSLLFPSTTNQLYGFDIQQDAIDHSRSKLKEKFELELRNGQITLLKECHSLFAGCINPGSASLIIYNLGYLPGSDHSITTMTPTTLQSLQTAITLLQPQGMLSITCYPKHPEGEIESAAIGTWAATLPYEVSYHTWPYRPKCPFLINVLKK